MATASSMRTNFRCRWRPRVIHRRWECRKEKRWRLTTVIVSTWSRWKASSKTLPRRDVNPASIFRILVDEMRCGSGDKENQQEHHSDGGFRPLKWEKHKDASGNVDLSPQLKRKAVIPTTWRHSQIHPLPIHPRFKLKMPTMSAE